MSPTINTDTDEETIDNSSKQAVSTLTFEDSLSLPDSKGLVWSDLIDPGFLVAALPGANSVDQVSTDRYTAEVIRGVGPVTLTMTADVQIVDKREPDWLIAKGEAYDRRTHTDIKGTVAIELTEIDSTSTLMRYRVETKICGGSGILSPRLLRPIVKKDLDEFFDNIEASRGSCGGE